MQIAEVQDRKSLQAYLNGVDEDARLLTARRVAFLAAARVAPLGLRIFAKRPAVRKRDLTALPIFMAVSYSGVASTWPTPEYDAAAAAAAASSSASSASSAASSSASSAAAYVAAASSAAASSSSASSAAASAAYVAASDFVFAYVAAASAAADIWVWVREDLERLAADPFAPVAAPWTTRVIPPAITAAWQEAKGLLEADAQTDWSFWILWYERVLVGKEIHVDKLAPILDTLTKEDILGDPALVMARFDPVLALYRGDGESTPLARAHPVEFTLDQFHTVMRLIGIDDDNAHLRADGLVNAFTDDAEETEEALQDFTDYAGSLAGGGNFAGVLQLAAEKLLREFVRTRDKTHLRARRIIKLARDLEDFSKDAKSRADLGEVLAKRLDDSIGLLEGLCRKHFGPSYLALAPLAQLSTDRIDQSEVVRLFDNKLAQLQSARSSLPIALDAEGIAVLDDMLRELHFTRAAVAEADTDDFRDLLEQRFVEGAGGLGLSLNRLFEQSMLAAGNVSRRADAVIRTNKRVKNLGEILEGVENGIGGAGL